MNLEFKALQLDESLDFSLKKKKAARPLMFLRQEKIRDSVFCSSEEEEATTWVDVVKRVNERSGGCEISAVLGGWKLLRREKG